MRKHAYWGLTLITAIAMLMVMASDAFLRPDVPPGADPRSWDLVGTFMLIAWGLATSTFLFFGDDKPTPPKALTKPLPPLTYREKDQAAHQSGLTLHKGSGAKRVP